MRVESVVRSGNYPLYDTSSPANRTFLHSPSSTRKFLYDSIPVLPPFASERVRSRTQHSSSRAPTRSFFTF